MMYYIHHTIMSQDTKYDGRIKCFTHRHIHVIGHVHNIPTMQFSTGISRNTQSKTYMLSLTECVWDFRNDALWDTH